jgi:uncharacterized protein (DUF427 family)
MVFDRSTPSARPNEPAAVARAARSGDVDGGEMPDRTYRAGSRLRTQRSMKRVRAYLGGRPVLDTVRPLLVWEKPYYPTYYIPVGDLLAELVETGDTAEAPDGTPGTTHHLQIGDTAAPSAATTFLDAHDPALLGHVRIRWDAMDAWFEEDEEVFVHPRSPYTRIDALRSSRHVLVEVEGVVVAESSSPVVLHETGLIPRYYLPPTDLRRALFVPSQTVTHCPYKGSATYLSMRAGTLSMDDLAWSYPFPTRESAPIAGLVAFFDERVDLILDGERQPRPDTPLLPIEG